MKRDWKAEAVKQWDTDPCGADSEAEFGTREFFSRVECERYETYAPWLPAAIDFPRYAGKNVLEVGFGLGTDLASFARAGARCFGIDLTPAHVRSARRRLELEGHAMRLVRADAEHLPFRDGSFDVAYSFGVLHHTPATARAIAEIHRVLRPGGEAIVGLYHRDSVFFWWSCILAEGLVKGGFLKRGYRATLSRIERQEHSTAVPLVKVYSRGGARRLFSRFVGVELKVYHFTFDQAGRLGSILERFLHPFAGQIARRFGWYLIIRAQKAVSL